MQFYCEFYYEFNEVWHSIFRSFLRKLWTKNYDINREISEFWVCIHFSQCSAIPVPPNQSSSGCNWLLLAPLPPASVTSLFVCLSLSLAPLPFSAFPLFRLSPLNVCLPCVNEVVAQRRPNNFSAKIFLQLAAKWYERKKLADKGELKIKAISLLITQQMAWQNEYFLSNSQDLPLLLAIVSFIMNESMELNWNNNYACK